MARLLQAYQDITGPRLAMYWRQSLRALRSAAGCVDEPTGGHVPRCICPTEPGVDGRVDGVEDLEFPRVSAAETKRSSFMSICDTHINPRGLIAVADVPFIPT